MYTYIANGSVYVVNHFINGFNWLSSLSCFNTIAVKASIDYCQYTSSVRELSKGFDKWVWVSNHVAQVLDLYGFIYYSNITWALWHLKLPASWLCSTVCSGWHQGDIKDLHCCHLCMESATWTSMSAVPKRPLNSIIHSHSHSWPLR